MNIVHTPVTIVFANYENTNIQYIYNMQLSIY